MKKAVLLVCILAISVATTACINNLAVQELNNKAAAFMEKENYPEAIERLKSSIDLDDSLFESHYNLAIAYTKNNDYVNAVNSYRRAIELNPDFADAYYSLAVAEEDIITDIYSGNLNVDEAGNITKSEDSNQDAEVNSSEEEFVSKDEYKIDDNAKAYVNEMTADAIKNYETYLEKGNAVSDRSEVEARIKELKANIEQSQQAAE